MKEAIPNRASPTGSESYTLSSHELSFKRRILSRDHKVIGLQYFWLSLIAALTGTFLSLLMRIHLISPALRVPGFGQIKPEDYLALVTMHGTLMVFFVLTTAPQSAFGNYFLPLQIGAREMCFPLLNMLSFWGTALSFLVMVSAFLVTGGAPISGWSQYTPLSAIPSAGPGQGAGMDLWIFSILIFCVSSLLGALNFIVTTLRSRTKGMSLMRMPLTVWAWFVTAVLTLLSFSVLMAAGILLLCDRHYGTSFFVPTGLVVNGNLITHRGGSPLLWQHLFWFFGHPEVYIAILPGMGVISTVISTFARKPVFGYRAMVYAIIAIGFLGFLVWGHHMFISGMSPYAVSAFSLVTLVIAVPSAIKTFNWLGTLWHAHIRFTTSMLFALGFVSLFVTGGLSGPMLAQPKLDTYLHDTYFVVAHFHLIMGMAAVFGIFAATYFWYPKMFGRMMSESLGRIHFWFSLVGAYATFVPMHLLGLAGHPRRYSELSESAAYIQQLIPVQRFITFAAIFLIAGQLVFLWNLFASLLKGRPADANPWQATTLEWSTSSPPPVRDFEPDLPIVYRGPYEFSAEEGTDFAPQWSPGNE
ncbi:MAG TPA: cbb3-type cytochrome c oxidase subunit I [Terriglobales bacterium]